MIVKTRFFVHPPEGVEGIGINGLSTVKDPSIGVLERVGADHRC